MSAGEGSHREALRPASRPRPRPERDGLLVVDPAGVVSPTTFGALPGHLWPGDLLVVNDAATLPASLAGQTAQGEPVELRLMACEREGVFWAARFGEGDHRTRTEHRAPGPALAPGDALALGPAGELRAEVLSVDPRSPRLLRVALSPRDPRLSLLHAVARAGRPVQYAHVPEPLALWDVQTIFASRPWAFEIPSAGRPFTHALVQRLRERGVAVASITHAAGLTSTGDEAIDALLPLPERSAIPEATAEAIEAARARGGRVVAAGTTVTRCLEDSAARHGRPSPGEFVATWKGSAGAPLRAVDALVTGMHAPGESHFELLRAFAPDEVLERAAEAARERGFLAHELGDSMLLFRQREGLAAHWYE